jgi:hypothetical protein
VSKREAALAAMVAAGFHGDERARVRLLVESRVARRPVARARPLSVF